MRLSRCEGLPSPQRGTSGQSRDAADSCGGSHGISTRVPYSEREGNLRQEADAVTLWLCPIA
jgi:hypothetical protein